MKNTAIQWTHHTLNFWWGCTQVSPACAHCYAEKFAAYAGKRIFGRPVLWGNDQPRAERLQAARTEALALERQAAKAAANTPPGQPAPRVLVFVNSMSDWLDDHVPVQWLAYLLETISLCPHLTFQLLTKRPENWAPRIEAVLKQIETAPTWETAAADSPEVQLRNQLADWLLLGVPLPNVWIGTTIENQAWADNRLPHLRAIPARVRFLSMEPLLGPVDLGFTSRAELQQEFLTSPAPEGIPANVMQAMAAATAEACEDIFGIHWIIAGGESGAGRKSRPLHPAWVYDLRDQAYRAGIPFFFKQWGDWLPCGPESAHLPANRRFKACFVGDGATKPGRPLPPERMLHVGTALAGNHLAGVQHLHFPPL